MANDMNLEEEQPKQEETPQSMMDKLLEQRSKQRLYADLLGNFQQLLGAGAAGTGFKPDMSTAEMLRKRAEEPISQYKEQQKEEKEGRKEKRETETHEMLQKVREQQLESAKGSEERAQKAEQRTQQMFPLENKKMQIAVQAAQETLKGTQYENMLKDPDVLKRNLETTDPNHPFHMMLKKALETKVNQNLKEGEEPIKIGDVDPTTGKPYSVADLTTVNSLIDKFGVAKGLTEYQKLNLTMQKERLGLEKEKQERLKKQHEERLGEQQEEQKAKIIDKFEKDKVVQKANESMAQANNVVGLVMSGNPIGHAAIPTFMARASGEVGNLSEADKRPFGGSRALSERIQAALQEYATGKLTEDNRTFIIDLAKTMKDAANRNKLSRAYELRNKYSKTYSLPMEEVNELMMPQLNQLKEEDAEAVEWALQNPDKPQSTAILKKNGLL